MSNKTRIIEKLIMSQTKVPMIVGAPGIGKTAIAQQIADKNNLMFIDIRLSQIDETEILGIPTVVDNTYFKYCVPEWAHKANNYAKSKFKGVLIFFDELNRAKQETLNGALQVLNERAIGYDFKFNDDVYFMSAGNLGQDDGTEVTELENAITDRLAIYKLNMTIGDWVNDYATPNEVDADIISFVENNPSEFYKLPDETETLKNYATPRSWTKLSEFLKGHSAKEKIELTYEVGESFVGNSTARFIKYLESKLRISLKDIIEHKGTKAELDALLDGIKGDKDKLNDLVSELKSFDLSKASDKKINNVIAFIDVLYDDLKIATFDIITDLMLTDEFLDVEDRAKIKSTGYYKILNSKVLKDDFNKFTDEETID